MEYGRPLYFCPVSDFSLSFFFFLLSSSPNLSGRRLDVYHTSAHGVALVRCMSEMCCTRLAENTGRKKSPFWHHRTILSGYIFGTKAFIDNQKKNLLNSNTSSMSCPHNIMVNFGLLIGLRSAGEFGTPPQISTGFAARHSVGVSQTLRRWREGATYIQQGSHHVGHWPTFLVLFISTVLWLDCFFWASRFLPRELC